MSDLLPPATYARSRGVTKQYISKCLDRGVLRRAVVTVSGRRLLDPTVADQEMRDNRPGASYGCWHEARGLPRRRLGTQDEDTSQLVDTVLIPFALDLFNRLAPPLAIFLRQEATDKDPKRIWKQIEHVFLLYWKLLGAAVGVEDLALDEKALPDVIARLSDDKKRAALVAWLGSTPPTWEEPTSRSTRRRSSRT